MIGSRTRSLPPRACPTNRCPVCVPHKNILRLHKSGPFTLANAPHVQPHAPTVCPPRVYQCECMPLRIVINGMDGMNGMEVDASPTMLTEAL